MSEPQNVGASSLLWSCKNCGHSYTTDDVTFPPFPEHLLKTNEPPSARELQELPHLLPVSELAAMGDEIASLQRTLLVLNERLERRIRAVKSISSPLRRVPPEIITEIISWATDEVSLDSTHGIWSYSRVCRAWRAIALDTPSLWSTISMSIHKESRQASFKYFAESVQTIISRSGNHAVSFKFTFDPLLCPAFYYDTASCALELLVEHAPRWREASLTIPHSSFNDLYHVKGRTPILESLELKSVGSAFVDGRGYLHSDYFQNAPSLRKVSVDNYFVDPTNIMPLPWSQITQYRAIDLAGDPLKPVELMPNLVTLRLDNLYETATEVVDLKLEKLRRLEVWGSGNLLPHLTLPELQELNIYPGSDSLYPMIDLLLRSKCRIATLEFQHHDYGIVDHDGLITLLQGLLHGGSR